MGNARTIKLIEGACLHGFSFSLRPENIDPVICVSARMRCATELGNSALLLQVATMTLASVALTERQDR